ncbi:hypothetical protein TNCV_2909271 [Trichonephila clavipes]|nr:hypothetical protein TNCV_2909271 [Trichonephila clavipes]
MLSASDKALLVKLFYMNEKSATIALRKFRVQKNVKSGKGPLTPEGLLKLVKRFEETGKLEDQARAGRPCLKAERAPCIAVEMEAIASRDQQCSRSCQTIGLTTIICPQYSSSNPPAVSVQIAIVPLTFASRYRTEGSICEVGLL